MSSASARAAPAGTAYAAAGAQGGEPGAPGRNLLNGEELPAKVNVDLVKGDVIRIETPGGGGWGRR
jgi:N-methylhydantoinase B